VIALGRREAAELRLNLALLERIDTLAPLKKRAS